MKTFLYDTDNTIPYSNFYQSNKIGEDFLTVIAIYLSIITIKPILKCKYYKVQIVFVSHCDVAARLYGNI